jgi:hypothetical protein
LGSLFRNGRKLRSMESDEGDDNGEDNGEDGEDSSTSIGPNKKNRSASGSLQTPQGQGIPSIPKFLHERGGNDEEEKVAEVGSEGGGDW